LEKLEIVAKAVDVAGKAAESISKELAALIQPLLRPGMEATGEMIADQINYWRLKRRVALVEKVMQLLESKNIKPKSVPPKILAAVLNTGSPGIPVVTGQSLLPRRAKALEILG
jgi:hypothetical protein